MPDIQPGILSDVPPLARYLFFDLFPDVDPRNALREFRDSVDGDQTVVGLGESLVRALDLEVEGIRTFPSYAGAGFEIPSTPAALWCWLRGEDRGELVHRTRAVEHVLSSAFRLDQAIDAFRYGPGLDLTGYEDGTENPKEAAAVETAVVRGRGPGLDGGSFVAVQKWIHNLDRFDAMNPETQDATIGRRKSDNAELEGAPPSAHIKRTSQESFDPAAFILRRSMPWADEEEAGLVFVAFGKSFDPFEALLRRMVGAEDGVPDALFRFTRPVSGGYFWCPPLRNGRLDLGALGL